MKIIPFMKIARTKGDRLWWVRCVGAGRSEPDYKMTLPLGMTITVCTGYDNITLVKFYFLSLCLGFGYKRKGQQNEA